MRWCHAPVPECRRHRQSPRRQRSGPPPTPARHRDATEHTESRARSSFGLLAVLKTARLLVTVGFRARVVATRFGLSGLLVISTRSGLADIDATSLRLPASWTLSAPNARRRLPRGGCLRQCGRRNGISLRPRRSRLQRSLSASIAALLAGIFAVKTTPLMECLVMERLPETVTRLPIARWAIKSFR